VLKSFRIVLKAFKTANAMPREETGNLSPGQ